MSGEKPEAKRCLYICRPRCIGKTMAQLIELTRQGITEIHVQESTTQKNLDKVVRTLRRTKANSYPGLAVKEGKLLNRIYKDVSKTLKEIGKR